MASSPLKPSLPDVGDRVTLFGLSGIVSVVEPQDDWNWTVGINVPGSFGSTETVKIIVPTDFRTTDGMPAYGE